MKMLCFAESETKWNGFCFPHPLFIATFAVEFPSMRFADFLQEHNYIKIQKV